ncbi:serine hydrolase [Lactobacillus sp. ESL0785]|uniref:serine hydrolase domain-containing protein n=1 Tax=Lactobacillus sp. ESL0785 TaxID=2983232 RepID=UPI0023F7FA3E|nr:serine hydrolase domain-containing protein [Lactobacillus sp. ESL0785]WEV70503.1 serine hydrolase [Lactobacillus sp. ESL0785]
MIPAAQPEIVQAATKAEMRKFVRKTMSKYHVRGSVVVVQDGKPQQISYGYALYGAQIGNGNAQIVYPTGSLQKVVTGAMIMQIMNQKKRTSSSFDQNTKISRWYPKLVNAKKISLGNLLTHTSGIKATNTEIWRYHTYSENAAVNWVVNNANNYAAGEVNSYHYNNTNYILLAGIIRKETGKSYQANLKERIVNKLGLKNTFVSSNIPKNKLIASSYYSNGDYNYRHPVLVTKAFASQLLGAGNLFTTPKEYYEIQNGLLNGQILTTNEYHYLTHLDSKVTGYSGGLHIKKGGKLKVAYGNLHGTHYATWVQLTANNQNGIVMFLNQTNDNAASEKKVGYQILQRIKKHTFVKG